MIALRFLPAVLSLLVLGAHFLRAGNLVLVAAIVAALVLVFVPRAWYAGAPRRPPAPLPGRGVPGVLLVAALVGSWNPAALAAAETTMARSETVVLLHGLSRSPRSLRRLERALATRGYDVVNVDYPAGRRPIDDLADLLDERLAGLRREPDRRVHFVTHSFGGILLRYYLKERPLPNLGRVVMLSPPSGGSELADLLRRIPVARRAAGPSRPLLGTDPEGLPARLGPVDFDVGVITGDRSINPLFSLLIPGPDDGCFVGVERARVAGMTDFLVVRRTHAFIMNGRDVIEQTMRFLRTGACERS